MAVYGLTGTAPAPSLAGVSPNQGLTAGGLEVTLAGQNFVTGAKVTFGGAAATNVIVTSGTQITAFTPAHKQGAVSIVITNPDGQSATLAAGFTYRKH